MHLSPDRRRLSLIALGLFVLAFLSFQYNAFRVTPANHFETFQLDSEILVLDGILHHQADPSGHGLGDYYHEELAGHCCGPDSFRAVRAQFEKGARESFFKPYISQFGLTYYLFDFLHTAGLSVYQMEGVAAVLMSLVVVGFFVLLSRETFVLAAIGFCLTLILSPWPVLFARNLYWVEFTWFAPTLLTLWLGGRGTSVRENRLLATLIFIALLIKFLCGYEYLTTICISALVPLVYFGVKLNRTTKEILRQAALISFAMFAAFVCAIAIHNISLTSSAEATPSAASATPDDGGSGLSKIILTAEKRLYASDPDKVAVAACKSQSRDNSADPKCVRQMADSLRTSGLKVLKTYVEVPELFPWSSGVRDTRYPFLGCSAILLAFLYWQNKLSSAVGWLASAFAAPLSWYIVGKAHSVIHTHINYVLWYLPYIPVAVMLLVCCFLSFFKNRDSHG